MGTGLVNILFMDLEDCNNEYLIHQINANDKVAFEVVFHKYYAPLCFFANKFVHNDDVAKDLVQEVFIRFYEKSVHFPNLVTLKSFLYSCVQNKALNYLEQAKARMAIRQKLNVETFCEDLYFCHQLEAEIFKEIFTAVEKLPQECRRIFKMSYIEMMDIHEISIRLNISESTIKTQRQRAKKFLREHLQHLYPLLLFLFIGKK